MMRRSAGIADTLAERYGPGIGRTLGTCSATPSCTLIGFRDCGRFPDVSATRLTDSPQR